LYDIIDIPHHTHPFLACSIFRTRALSRPRPLLPWLSLSLHTAVAARGVTTSNLRRIQQLRAGVWCRLLERESARERERERERAREKESERARAKEGERERESERGRERGKRESDSDSDSDSESESESERERERVIQISRRTGVQEVRGSYRCVGSQKLRYSLLPHP
jgi:hypothetical protein